MSEESVTRLMLKRLDKIDVKLDRIEVQTTKTNGRVDTLEKQSVKDKQHLDSVNSRVVNIEKTLAVDDALSGRNNRLVDLAIKFGPWIIVFLFFIFEVGSKTGVIG